MRRKKSGFKRSHFPSQIRFAPSPLPSTKRAASPQPRSDSTAIRIRSGDSQSTLPLRLHPYCSSPIPLPSKYPPEPFQTPSSERRWNFPLSEPLQFPPSHRRRKRGLKRFASTLRVNAFPSNWASTTTFASSQSIVRRPK